MDKTLFFVFGIALVVSAVGIAAHRAQVRELPLEPGVLLGVIMYFAALVGATAVFAVLNARDEQHDAGGRGRLPRASTTTSDRPVRSAQCSSRRTRATIAYTTRPRCRRTRGT